MDDAHERGQRLEHQVPAHVLQAGQIDELDPGYAQAWAGLADSYALLGVSPYGLLPTSEAMPRAKAAALRAGIPGPIPGRQWTLHSLRHLYGVYMLNDYPIAPAQKRFGIPLTDVQMLMGHKSIRTTAKYARPKVDRVIAKLRTSDEQMLGMTDEERKLLPSGVLEHLSLK